MIVLHIEHQVVNFESWKASFDNFGDFRQKSGVRRYQVSRRTDKRDVVMIDLEFDQLSQAQALLAGVQQVWKQAAGTLIHNPEWRFSEVVETRELSA